MFNKNHVGRPSNEELKARRNKKIAIICIPVFLLLLIGVLIYTNSFQGLMGNSVTNYYCEDNTYVLNGNKCEKTLKEKPIILGDLNKDDKVTNEDFTILEEYVNLVFDNDDYEFSEEQILRADIDGDGEIYNSDVSILYGYLKKEHSRLDTYSPYYQKVGTKKMCMHDYKLENGFCIKKLSIDAKIKKSEEQVGSNNTKEEVKYFTINYNANGGTGSMPSQKIIYGNDTKLSKNLFTNNDSIFDGWKILNNSRTSSTGVEQWACYKNSEKTDKGYATKDVCEKFGYQIYDDETTVAQTANPGETITMYATWKSANYFTVKYNANGGTGSMPDQKIEYGKNTKLNSNKFKSNKMFNGWKVYNNSRNLWGCYKNSSKTDQGYTDESYCKKYGYVIYKDETTVAQTANPNETVTMYATWKDVSYFTVKYNANGGTGSMPDQKIEYGKNTKLSRNQFTNNGKLIRGWKIYNNSRNLWACYKNSSKTDYGYASKDICEKYGYQIYKNMATVARTANKGETITLYATWIDLSSYFNVKAEKEFATLELNTKNLKRQKIIQDIYVNKDNIFVSQDNWQENPAELIITRISRKNHSMQEVYREKKCGHGFFTIPDGVLMTTCDYDTSYKKDAHGHKAYKVVSSGKRKLLVDAFKNERETFKIDFNHNIYMARINDGMQQFRFYKYDNKTKDVGEYIRKLKINDTKYDMQGYALDGNYIYIYYGEGIDSGSNRLNYSIAYIDVYNAKNGNLIKKNKIFESKDTYMEAEGLDYLGDSVYIGIATTDEYNSAYGDIKYANVYRIKKSDLIN